MHTTETVFQHHDGDDGDDGDGDNVQAPAQCWKYTWLGAANERVNSTTTCRYLLMMALMLIIDIHSDAVAHADIDADVDVKNVNKSPAHTYLL